MTKNSARYKKFVIPEDEEAEGGFIANLSPEELNALEVKKTRLAALELAKRAQERRAKEEAEKEKKKAEWRKKRMYVKGSKICEANRVYEEQGWFVCEVCTKKFNDIEWVEEHVKTDKHKSNLDWYATRPLPEPTSGETHGSAQAQFSSSELPPHVVWDEEQQYYVCELCSAKAACEAILDMHLNGKEHQKRLLNVGWYLENPDLKSRPNILDELPVYCELSHTADLPYLCRWCDKKASTVDLLLSHLEGKDHARKCSNIGIPHFGETGHLQAAAAYTAKYGMDLWARQEHWPDWMVDEAEIWKCQQCNKRFITPSAVNDHLASHAQPKKAGGGAELVKTLGEMVEISKKNMATRKGGVPPKPNAWLTLEKPTSGKSENIEYTHSCNLCMLPFDSLRALTHHENTDRDHQTLFERLNGLTRPTRQAPALDLLDI